MQPTKKVNRLNLPNSSVSVNQPEKQTSRVNPESPMEQTLEITKRMVNKITELKSLKYYGIRELVKHAEEFGPYLKKERLETNQIRKFLDAVNQLKAKLAQDDTEQIKQTQEESEKEKLRFAEIETEVVLLKPKLAYAAARQRAAKPMNDVMSAAIDKVCDSTDFERLVQLIESIIAYHKAEGGK